MTTADGVTLRHAFPDDAQAVDRLAALDSRSSPPPAPLLLAEIDGEPWAALSLKDGTTIADPFRPTAALLDLLRRRHAQLAAAEETSRPRRRRLRARAARSVA
ncbi:hypothetical protein [Conexibacter woesei]|uniref:hypothetical protein n=1 Tax=Conexibacter woesei TaxID=191495 RepID=UPI0004138E91|nr:hypothetical protein [Conexibacter woesei]